MVKENSENFNKTMELFSTEVKRHGFMNHGLLKEFVHHSLLPLKKTFIRIREW